MSAKYNEHRIFKCEKLSVFTCRDTETVQATYLRKYIKKHWRKIFQGMTNSTILIIGGVHGSASGEVGVREENMKSIENQVGWKKKTLRTHLSNFILFCFLFFYSLLQKF